MEHDVFDYYDCVVNHQADSSRQAAQRHQVEALPCDLEEDNRNHYRRWDHQSRYGGRTPIAKKNNQDNRGKNQSYQDGVSNTGYALSHQERLVVERSEFHAWWKHPLQILNFA